MSRLWPEGQIWSCTFFHRRNSGSVGIYGKRGIKTNVTFSEGSPPELCVIVPIDKRGWACENMSIFCVSKLYFLYVIYFVYCICIFCVSIFAFMYSTHIQLANLIELVIAELSWAFNSGIMFQSISSTPLNPWNWN